MMESDRRIIDGNVSSNEKAALHAEPFGTKETNTLHSRILHPPYEKWNISLKYTRDSKDCQIHP